LQNINLLTNSLESGSKEELEQESGELFLQKILLKGLKNLEDGSSQKKRVSAMDLKTLQQIRKGLLKGGWIKNYPHFSMGSMPHKFLGELQIVRDPPSFHRSFRQVFGFTVERFRF
jgi:hypothetical protein